MKKYIFLAVLLASFQSIACSTFFINTNGELVFGRNYDWMTGAGMVCNNLRGLYKTSMKREDGNTISWVSKYGSITFNQYGKEFPTGGMNEKGLVVELMWLDGTKYAEADNRPAVGVLQWIQYQLDNNATIKEVIATEENIRISVQNPPLHYLIADAYGHAATIEFFNGKMVVHEGNDLPLPVLTNNPYSESEKAAKIALANKNFQYHDNSLQRFTKACSMVQDYQQNNISKPAVDYAFDILNDVAQGGYTKWSIVYDVKNKKIHFKTSAYRSVKTIGFNSFDFNCGSVAKVFNMNQSASGDISNSFVAFTIEFNRKIIEQAINESKERVPVSDKEKEALIAYTGKIKCKE